MKHREEVAIFEDRYQVAKAIIGRISSEVGSEWLRTEMLGTFPLGFWDHRGQKNGWFAAAADFLNGRGGFGKGG